MNLFWFSTQSKNKLIADLVIWNLSSKALICRKSTLLFLCSRNFGGQSFSVPHDFRHWLKVSCRQVQEEYIFSNYASDVDASCLMLGADSVCFKTHFILAHSMRVHAKNSLNNII